MEQRHKIVRRLRIPGNNRWHNFFICSCMKQMHIDESVIVNLDYEAPGLSAAMKEFKPVVFRDKEGYGCLLGESREAGVFGWGSTVAEAIADWQKHFAERMQRPRATDELVQYILDTRNASKKDVW